MDKFFKISERGSTVKTEIVAGLTTFFAMAYIIFVNPNQVIGFMQDVPGMSKIWNAVYIASILVAVISTLLMGLYAKMPFALACCMGLNSFFFASFILPAVVSGNDVIDGYQSGLVIILLSGLVFLLMSVSGLRNKIARALPDCLKKAIPAGIGLFIAFIGFQNVGIIQTNQYTLVQFNDIHGAITGGSFLEDSFPALLALFGVIAIAVMEKRKVKGAVLIIIAAIAVIYHAVNYAARGIVPSFEITQIGQSFKDFAEVGISGVFQVQSWKDAFTGEAIGGVLSAIMLIISFCLVDMFDTIGTLYGACAQAGLMDENGDPVNADKCMLCDALGTAIGAAIGTSTCTTFVESAAGVGAGGRTGLTSVIVSICFAICIVLSPLASLVPSCATAPALIWVGVLMLKGFAEVDMDDIRSAVPAFLALIMMPLTYSISNGIGIGAIAYVLITLATGKYKKNDIIVTVIAALFVLRFCLITM